MTIISGSILLLWVLVVSSLGARAAEGTAMDDKVTKIAEAAKAEYGWTLDEMRIDEVERLRQQSCTFYTVGNTVRPLSYQANYALVGGKVVAPGDGNVVARILDACSNGAGADWWAEIVTRFHRNLGSGIVLRDETVRPDIVRKMAAAGEKFTRPAMDKAKHSLTFLLLNPETYILYRVQATRNPGGPVEVVKSKILPAAA